MFAVASEVRFLSPQDRDLSVRTMIGEAGNQPDEGVAAVGHVILNRTKAGSYGDSPAAVVLAPGQFEPWQTRHRELLSYSPQSPEYTRAGNIFDGVAGGSIEDPTGGATHFLNEKVVRQRRGGSLPDWASGESLKIGDHTFYGGKPKAQVAAAEHQDPFVEFANGKDVAEFVKAAPATAAVPPSKFKDVFEEFANPDAVAPAGPPHPPISGLDPTTPEYAELQARPSAVPAGGGFRKDIAEIGRGIAETPAAIWRKTGENIHGGMSLTESGVEDLRNNRLLPAFPSTDPQTWEGGGILKTAGGALGVATSIPAAISNRLIGEPVTELTGNPSAGERAELLGGGAAAAKLTRAGVKTLPGNRALSDIAETIGPERFGEVARRLRENPRPSPMDEI